MFRVRRDPIWILLIVGPVLVWLWFANLDQRGWVGPSLIMLGALIALRLAFWLLANIRRSPVPNSAVKELLARCENAGPDQEWVLVEFRPNLSLEEARLRAGSASYSKEDRLRGFMTKFQFAAPSRPDIAVFHSSEKGYLLGRVAYINTLERKYGRWMLNTWYSLMGAMTRTGMTECSLDGGQFFVHGQHVGS